MKKSILAFAAVLALAVPMTSFASNGRNINLVTGSKSVNTSTQRFGGCGIGGYMMDENGNLPDREIYQAELDKQVASGELSTEDKEYFLRRYDMMKENLAYYERNGYTGYNGSGRGGCCR